MPYQSQYGKLNKVQLLGVQVVQQAGGRHSEDDLPVLYLQLLGQTPTMLNWPNAVRAGLPHFLGVETLGPHQGEAPADGNICKYLCQLLLSGIRIFTCKFFFLRCPTSA